MLDVFSRYVVGRMVAHRESATLAERFIHETCTRQRIGREQLTIHADRGSAMTSKSVAFLLAEGAGVWSLDALLARRSMRAPGPRSRLPRQASPEAS